MFSKKDTVDIGPLLTIIVILIIIIFSIFYYFNFQKEENKDISKIINQEEIKKTEVDITEIEKRLDELDIDLDDLLKELKL